jgi:hypothetical protein
MVSDKQHSQNWLNDLSEKIYMEVLFIFFMLDLSTKFINWNIEDYWSALAECEYNLQDLQQGWVAQK